MACILIVEDDPTLARILARYLKLQGHDVRTLETGEEALDVLEGLDVIITDIKMPEMDGIELIIEVREVYPSVPVIVMSGNPSRKMLLDSAKKLGAVKVLEKPFDLDTLEVAVMEVLRGRQGS